MSICYVRSPLLFNYVFAQCRKPFAKIFFLCDFGPTYFSPITKGSEQCDQIWLFLKALVKIFLTKIAKISDDLMSFFQEKLRQLFFGQHLKKVGYFWFYHLVTLVVKLVVFQSPRWNRQLARMGLFVLVDPDYNDFGEATFGGLEAVRPRGWKKVQQ